MLEPRFNVETMAQLLNIPPNKTLLRRHLATHFNLLIGAEAQRQKRDAMELPDYVLLTATAKVKVGLACPVLWLPEAEALVVAVSLGVLFSVVCGLNV